MVATLVLVVGILSVSYAWNIDVIEEMVVKRNLYRKQGDFIKADSIKEILESNFDVLVVDYPNSSWQFKKKTIKPLNLMAYSRNRNINDVEIENVKRYLQNILYHDVIYKMGRKYADLSFNFALSGVCDSELYDLLLQITTKELLRYGDRKSCRLVDIVNAVEKLAISGMKYEQFDALKELLARKCSSAKDKMMIGGTIEDIANSKFSLFSLYPLLSMYSFLSRQQKVTTTSVTSCTDINIADLLFFNNSYPIVLELGSGFGLNVLNLQSQYKNYNYVGIDLNPQSIAYSNSIATRWNVTNQVKFVVGDVKLLLHKLISYTKDQKIEYKTHIDTIVVNFPTPFSVCIYDDGVSNATNLGNSQLPINIEEFMMSPKTLELIKQLFMLQKEKSPSHRYNLYVQSNIEDVIIYIKNEIDKIGRFQYPRDQYDARLLNSINILCDNCDFFATGESSLPLNKRQSVVEQKLGGGDYAVGSPYLARAPYNSVSETEIHCIHNNKRIYRLLTYICN